MKVSESMTSLWWKKDKNDIEYLAGNLNATTKVMVLPNTDKKNDKDPDCFLYLGATEESEKDTPKARKPDKINRRINAKYLLKDIRKGLSDSDLRKKYHVSQKGLHKLFHKLVDAGRLTQSDIDGRS